MALEDWFWRDIIAPATELDRETLRYAQRKLRLTATGEMDGPTRAALRGVQRFFSLEAHGYLDKATARRLETLRAQGEADASPKVQPEGA